MALNTAALQETLCKRLPNVLRVERRPDGALMLHTHFQFTDGDHYPIRITETPSGGLRLSDHGRTVMHMSYEYDVDHLFEGVCGELLQRIVGECGIRADGGVFYLDTTPEKLAEAAIQFGQALTRIDDLTLLPREKILPAGPTPAEKATFYRSLDSTLCALVNGAQIRRRYRPEIPNAQSYTVDYRIQAAGDAPLFLYGVHSRGKAAAAAAMLAHFQRRKLVFHPVIVFHNRSKIPEREIRWLADAGCEMVNSPASLKAFRRSLRHCAA